MIDADRIHTASTTTRINLQQRPTVSRRLSSVTLPNNTRLDHVSVNPIPDLNVTLNPLRSKNHGKLLPRTISLFSRKRSSVVSLNGAGNQLTRMPFSSKAHDIPGSRTPIITHVDFIMLVERERILRMVVESTVTERADDGFNRAIKGVAKQ